MRVYLYDWFGLLAPEDADDYSALFDTDPAAEMSVSTCMADAGFEYQTLDANPEARFAGPDMAMAPADYAAQYGLGISAQPLGLFPQPDGAEQDNEFRDYFDQLTEGQVDAYFDAYNICQVENGNNPRVEGPALNVAATGYRELVYADDRVSAAKEDWQACLAAAGFTFDDPQQMVQSFIGQLTAIAPDWSVEQGTPQYREMERLFAFEREVALVNVECEATYAATLRQVVDERISEFWHLFDAALAGAASQPDSPVSIPDDEPPPGDSVVPATSAHNES